MVSFACALITVNIGNVNRHTIFFYLAVAVVGWTINVIYIFQITIYNVDKYHVSIKKNYFVQQYLNIVVYIPWL